MFGSRRLAKRSIVGTRVAAKWQDGRYYAGVIKGVYAEETPFTDAVYTILFEDGYEKSTPSKSIVGPGFQPCSTCVLKKGQKAFLTLNGREISGTVINHATDVDEVLLNVQLVNGDEIDIIKRIDEVRLLKSRKSARLQDQDTDYSKMADLQLTEARKRTVSSGIDMPSKSVQHGYRTIHLADDADGNTNGTMGSDDSSEDVEMMDENIAALVLTSLSCSPQSPQFTAQDFRDFTRNGQLSSSVASSGFHSNQSEHSDPSPPTPSHLSESAPETTSAMFDKFQKDEGIDVTDVKPDGTDNGSPKQIQSQKKTMYQCTWPGCNKISATCEAIEKHVRDTHLGSDTENEEDFYYTEIEVNVDNVTRGFSDMCTSASSPPAAGSAPATPSFVIPDHDYQKKEFRQVFASSVPSTSAFLGHAHTMPIPIKVSEIQRSLSWQNTHSYATSPSPPIRISNRPSPQERLQQHQAQSPKLHTGFPTSKSLSIHKKPRSEVRKCRKVYGMDNRDMWCTQCKWKKACTRFLD